MRKDLDPVETSEWREAFDSETSLSNTRRGRHRAENRSTRKVDNILGHVALRLTIAEIGGSGPDLRNQVC
jgi:hypothetical protein